jgi:hypothetical protein
MTEVDEILDGIAEAYDEVRAFSLPGSVAVLLKMSGTANAFVKIFTLSHWLFEDPNQFRTQFLLSVADNSDGLAAAMKEVTHISIDNDYYVVPNHDPTRPKGAGAIWKLLCERDFEARAYGAIY